MPKFLILTHLGDPTALRVCSVLRSRHGESAVRLVSAQEMSLAPAWRHRLGRDGVLTELAPAQGPPLRSDRIGIVFNRLRFAEVPQFQGARARDRDYAHMETAALWLSALAALPCPVVNPATPRNLGGRDRGRAEWMALASKAGLPVSGYRFTTDPRRFPACGYIPHRRLPALHAGGPDRWEPLPPLLPPRGAIAFLEPLESRRRPVLVAGSRVLGEAGPLEKRGLLALSELSGCALFEAAFSRTPPGRISAAGADERLTGIDPYPLVRDRLYAEAVATMLEERRASGAGTSA